MKCPICKVMVYNGRTLVDHLMESHGFSIEDVLGFAIQELGKQLESSTNVPKNDEASKENPQIKPIH